MTLLSAFSAWLDDSTAVVKTVEEVVGEDVYIVMIVTLIIWLGVFFYMMFLGKEVRELKKQIEN